MKVPDGRLNSSRSSSDRSGPVFILARSLCQFDPDWRMITRVRPAADVTVHFGSHKPISKITAHQNMIETKASVAPEGVAEIIEECVDPLVRMKSADCICPSLCDEPLECLADIRMKQGVIAPAIRLVDVKIGRNDVEVPRQDNGHAKF